MNLKERRKKMNLSQMEVAKGSNIPQSTYSGYESGKIQPDKNSLIKLADFFNVSIDELVERDTEIVNLNFIDETKKQIIKEILQLNTNLTNQVNAYLQGMKLAEEERELIREYIKNKGNK